VYVWLVKRRAYAVHVEQNRQLVETSCWTRLRLPAVLHSCTAMQPLAAAVEAWTPCEHLNYLNVFVISASNSTLRKFQTGIKSCAPMKRQTHCDAVET